MHCDASENRQYSHTKMTSPGLSVERLDDVTFDCFASRDIRRIADISVWRAAHGFECLASIGDDIYHGLSSDGKRFVFDRYPVIAGGRHPHLTVTDGIFYLCYVAKAPEREIGLHVAQSADIHTLPIRQAVIVGLAPQAEVCQPAIIKSGDRWGMFVETLGGDRRSIAYALAETFSGPWVVVDPPLADLNSCRASDCEIWNPTVMRREDTVLFFYQRICAKAREVFCVSVRGDSKTQTATIPFAASFGDRLRISSAVEWGGTILLYLRVRHHFRRARLKLAASA